MLLRTLLSFDLRRVVMIQEPTSSHVLLRQEFQSAQCDVREIARIYDHPPSYARIPIIVSSRPKVVIRNSTG